jgi:tetratricopeptide (TPR) repeat protein
MHDLSARYPLLRRRRRRSTQRGPDHARRMPLRLLAVLVLAALVLGGIVILARRASAPDPARAYEEGVAALARGNYSAARNHALIAAVGTDDPARANVLLGRVNLLMEDGSAAEAALNRAVAAGLPAARINPLLAEAFLLQGDPDRALATASRAAGPMAAEARRVRALALAAKGDLAGATAQLTGLVNADPRNSRANGDLARLRMEAGDVLGAEVAARSALAVDPTNLGAVVVAGQVIRSRYGLVAALPWFARALESDAYYYPALIEYAATAGDAGQYGIMLDASRKALATRPGSVPALYLQAVLAARAGKRDLARAMLAKTGDDGIDIPGVVLLAGLLAYADGAYEQAVVSFREIVGRQPMNLVARRLLGASLLRTGDVRGALDTLRPMALRSDADSYTLMLVARAFEANGERDWAARFLDRANRPAIGDPSPFASDLVAAAAAAAVARAPDDPALAVANVRSLLEAGEPGAAQRAADVVANASRGASDAQLLAGDVHAATGQWSAALERYRLAADLRFDGPSLLRLSEAAVRAARPRDGAGALTLYLSQNPHALLGYRLLGNLQLASGDWDAAVTTLEELRSGGAQRDAFVLAQLAQAYTEAGDPQSGLAYARRAYGMLPMNPGVADAYGWALYETGNIEGALQLLAKAVALAPGDPAIRWHEAQALAEAGRTAAAQRAIRSLLGDSRFQPRAPAEALLRAIGG